MAGGGQGLWETEEEKERKDGREGQAEGDEAPGTCPTHISPSGLLLTHHPRRPLLTSRGCKQAQGLFRGTPAERQQRRGESTVRWRPADSSPIGPVWQSTPPSLCPQPRTQGAGDWAAQGCQTHCTELRTPFSVSQVLCCSPGRGLRTDGVIPGGSCCRPELHVGPEGCAHKQRAAVPSYLYLWVLWPLDTQD